jgi:hypothetical protein
MYIHIYIYIHILNIGCTSITDTGVGKIAKASERLQYLDLHGCIAVGEFGDHALKEIGAFCGELKVLDLGGCKRVEDAGLQVRMCCLLKRNVFDSQFS